MYIKYAAAGTIIFYCLSLDFFVIFQDKLQY